MYRYLLLVPRREDFFQAQAGQRPDGNVRIADTYQGRAFEPRGNKRRPVQNLPRFRRLPFPCSRPLYFHYPAYFLYPRGLRSHKGRAHQQQHSNTRPFHHSLLTPETFNINR
jgi:hypothetical protein